MLEQDIVLAEDNVEVADRETGCLKNEGPSSMISVPVSGRKKDRLVTSNAAVLSESSVGLLWLERQGRAGGVGPG